VGPFQQGISYILYPYILFAVISKQSFFPVTRYCCFLCPNPCFLAPLSLKCFWLLSQNYFQYYEGKSLGHCEYLWCFDFPCCLTALILLSNTSLALAWTGSSIQCLPRHHFLIQNACCQSMGTKWSYRWKHRWWDVGFEQFQTKAGWDEEVVLELRKAEVSDRQALPRCVSLLISGEFLGRCMHTVGWWQVCMEHIQQHCGALAKMASCSICFVEILKYFCLSITETAVTLQSQHIEHSADIESMHEVWPQRWPELSRINLLEELASKKGEKRYCLLIGATVFVVSENMNRWQPAFICVDSRLSLICCRLSYTGCSLLFLCDMWSPTDCDHVPWTVFSSSKNSKCHVNILG